MKMTFIIKTIIVSTFTITLLLAACLTVQTLSLQAHAASPSAGPSSGPMPTGPSAIVTISSTEGAYEFTPYQMSIALDNNGVIWVNQTSVTQTVVSDTRGISSVTIAPHKSKELSLPNAGTYHFHLKTNYNVPHFTVIKQHQ